MIVARRKAHEYKLKTKGAPLSHFLRYAHYELTLDRLRVRRLNLAGACGCMWSSSA